DIHHDGLLSKWTGYNNNVDIVDSITVPPRGNVRWKTEGPKVLAPCQSVPAGHYHRDRERGGRQHIPHVVAEQRGDQADGGDDADQNRYAPHAFEGGVHHASFPAEASAGDAASLAFGTFLRLSHKYRPL